MTSPAKIRLAPSRDIPFNKLVLSQANVRRVKAGVSIEELAEDIARRGLLQGLSVRPIIGEDSADMFEIPAGGRRFRALELLVRQKRLARTAPVPCIVREDGLPEEDSLAENVQRAPLHPLDQFRAFQALRGKGQSEEEIAATFFVPVTVVRQRLKLAAVSPKLLDAYAEDGLSLDQLMAFTVCDDPERQEQVFERLGQCYDKQPHAIRRMLTEQAVRASDKRARFVGIDAYVEAGGPVMRDLFQADDGGWLQDAGLLDHMVADKLSEAAVAVRVEGWKWIEVAPSFPYGHTFGLRQLRGETAPLTLEEEAARAALHEELETLEQQYMDAHELPEEAERRFGEIETALAAFDERPVRFAPEEVTRAGAFVSIDAIGGLRVERGYVRPEDELPVEPEPEIEGELEEHDELVGAEADDPVPAGPEPAPEPEEDEGLKPLPDRLVAELTAHRTLALRHALGENPDVAFLAALHALCIRVFYRYALDSCLELELRSVGFAAQAPGLADTPPGKAIDAHQQAWGTALPREPQELWDALAAFDGDSRRALFAHCVALSVNAVVEPYNRRPRAIAHADRLAQAVDLDMAAAGWRPTIDTFFGRVTKARILQAVREGCGERQAQRINHLKKGEMAAQAEALLAASGWLPEPLRTPGRAAALVAAEAQEPGIGDACEPLGAGPADDETEEDRGESHDSEAPGESDAADTDGLTVAAE